MAQAFITPAIITWARQRAGMSLPAFARAMNQPEEKVIAWEAGEERPTFTQAQTLAKKLHIPFGYLFLATPPQETLPIPDLRTVGDHEPGNLSLDFRDTLTQVLERQEWFKEYLTAQDAGPNRVVGRCSAADPATKIAADMHAVLGLPAYPTRGIWEEYNRELVRRIETHGVLVMRNSMVGRNTHRPLSAQEFRGFAIADPIAPVIFVNSADCREAQLFTLIHELAHIWTGQSGISDASEKTRRQEEQLSNAVAAEFLVPQGEFRALWREQAGLWENVTALAPQFRVSQWVIARRALTLGLLPLPEYQTFAAKKYADYQKSKKDRDPDNTGPSPQVVQKGRVSELFARTIVAEALSGRVLLRDAAHLLGEKPANIAKFATKGLGA